MIIVEHLFFDYPGKKTLNDISFKIQTNTVTGLVGPNGSGKTTLLRCLAALQQPSSGHIILEEEGVRYQVEDEPRKIHQLCSYVSDFFGLYDELTVKQCLQYIAWSKGCLEHTIEQKIQLAVERLQLEKYLNVKASTLSRGLRQRVAIAQSIVQEPKILFLDEPASGLDPEARYHLSQLLLELRSHGLTIIVSSHILSELEDYCTHMLVIQSGKILDHRALAVETSNDQNMQSVYLELMQRNTPNDPQS